MKFWARGLLAVAALTTTSAAAVAQRADYPERNITVIVPFPPGGASDITARLAADKLGDKLGQRFVVENQPGPGGISAARSVLTSASMMISRIAIIRK